MHFSVPHSGQLHLFNRANKFHEATVQTHCNDLIEIFKNGFSASLCIRADRGPDWGCQNMIVVVFLGRLWMDMKMDALVVAYYAAANSAFGAIERMWATVSKWLAGVTFQPILPGEQEPPAKQSGLSKEQLRSKEEKLFDILLKQLEGYYSSKSIGGYPVEVKTVPSVPNVPQKYSDQTEWKNFLNRTAKILNAEGKPKNPEDKKFLEPLAVILQHIVRWEDMLVFRRCQGCSHCNSLDAVRSPDILQHLRQPRFPRDDNLNPAHFQTFIQQWRNDVMNGSQQFTQPPTTLVSCGTCNFVFQSEAEQERHWEYAHQGKPCLNAMGNRFVCNFLVAGIKCGMRFTTKAMRERHKQEENHKQRRSNNPINNPTKSKPPAPPKISALAPDMARVPIQYPLFLQYPRPVFNFSTWIPTAAIRNIPSTSAHINIPPNQPAQIVPVHHEIDHMNIETETPPIMIARTPNKKRTAKPRVRLIEEKGSTPKRPRTGRK